MNVIDQETLCGVARLAGLEIMRIHDAGFTIADKKDRSPVTEADRAADALIRQALAQTFPDIPVLSEESDLPPYAVRKKWKRFLLVDPLDGTKEFIKKNGEFTVNIALIEKNRPRFGVIHVPARDCLYFGGKDLGAFRQDGAEPAEAIATRKPQAGQPVIVLQSRSHPDPRLETFLARYPERQSLEVGSALKFCLLAEGDAHLYPRLNPTMEWDVAAGHAIVEGAGGSLTTLDGDPFPYNKPDLLNGPFVATS